LRDGIDDARLDEIYAGVRARRRSRRWRQRVLVPALALTCAAAAVVAVRREAPAAEVVAPRDALRFADGGALVPAAVLEVAELAPPRVIALSDGTRITLGAGSRLVPRASTADRLELSVERGRARFEVQPQRGRHFVVSAGALSVEVVGTAFSVARGAGGAEAEVAVEHGRVRVRAPGLPGGERMLGAGDSLRWPAPDAAAEAAPPPAVQPQPPAPIAAAPAVAPAATAAPALSPAFRAAVQDGDYPRAYRLLGSGGYARAVRNERAIDALLQLADVARGANKPRAAALALSRLIELHPEGDRSALAALTLGRLQLDVLAQPAAAARSLRAALAAGLPAALQEDALARMVDALARGGQAAEAQRAAAQYRARFPEGRWRASVEQWAGGR
jgi:transmembrane sensor